ncbi:MAG: ATPase, T2SS/T4P/T4SS family, partial [Planctomycetota bacterium]
MNSTELMGRAIDAGASDLHLNPGRPPVGRVDGRLVSLGTDVVDDETAKGWCRELCELAGSGGKHWKELEDLGTTDLGVAHESGTRFRVSCMRQRGRHTAILRLIPDTLLTFEQIGLPESVQELLRRPRGLVLVTGPTGSGKSTTL